MSDLLAAASHDGCGACASNVKRHDLPGLTRRMRQKSEIFSSHDSPRTVDRDGWKRFDG